MRRIVRISIVAAVVLDLADTTIAWQLGQKKDHAAFRTAPVKRTNLVATISATGTVEPEELVDVGAQVAGQIQAFGKDKQSKPIDYGSAVEEGTVLAQIDDTLYAADVLSRARSDSAAAPLVCGSRIAVVSRELVNTVAPLLGCARSGVYPECQAC